MSMGMMVTRRHDEERMCPGFLLRSEMRGTANCAVVVTAEKSVRLLSLSPM